MDTSLLKSSQVRSTGWAILATCTNILSTGSQHWAEYMYGEISHAEGLWRACTGGLCYDIPKVDFERLMWQYFSLISCALTFIAATVLIFMMYIREGHYPLPNNGRCALSFPRGFDRCDWI